MTFDYIVGNPPYNGSNKNGSLYANIMIRCVEMLKEMGQMSVIHPNSYRLDLSSTRKLSEIYKQHTLKAQTHDVYFCRYIWNVRANVDEVILTKNNVSSFIITEEDTLKTLDVTKQWKHYPVMTRHNDLFMRYMKYSENKQKIVVKNTKRFHKNTLKKEKDEIYVYPIFTKILKEKRIHEGLFYTKSIFEKRPKIILSWGSLHNFLDLTGEYQGTNTCYYIFDENDNIDKLKKLYDGLDDPLFKKILQSWIGSDQHVIVDQYMHKLEILKYLSIDFYDITELLKKEGYKIDDFTFSTRKIKNSGHYEKYVNHAKNGSSWKNNLKMNDKVIRPTLLLIHK